MKENIIPVITKEALMCYSLEVCEFCEKTFENRYDSLVHNASHIIIPLLKHTSVRCNKCTYHCTSQNDLNHHIITVHPLVIKTERLNFWDTSNIDKYDLSKKETKQTEAINKYMQKQVENKVKCNEVNGISDSIKDRQTFIIEKDLTVDKEYNEFFSKKTSVVDRLRFENEHILDQLQNANSNKQICKPIINITSTSVPQCYNGRSQKHATEADSTVDCNNVSIISLSKYEADTNSYEFSYHALNKPHSSICRYCSTIFPSRLDLTVHEKTHMRFIQKISGSLCIHCDKYIAGTQANLAKHIDSKHFKHKHKVYCTSVCKRCGLQYRSYKHHMHNYHSKCCNLNKFVTENNLKNHLDKCLCQSHVLSVCRLCYNILQEDNNLKCVTLGIKRTTGVLQDCKKCDNKVHEIISVKMSCKIQPKLQYWFVQQRPLSNKDRLKNIRIRLKKLNIMSKT